MIIETVYVFGILSPLLVSPLLKVGFDYLSSIYPLCSQFCIVLTVQGSSSNDKWQLLQKAIVFLPCKLLETLASFPCQLLLLHPILTPVHSVLLLQSSNLAIFSSFSFTIMTIHPYWIDLLKMMETRLYSCRPNQLDLYHHVHQYCVGVLWCTGTQ